MGESKELLIIFLEKKKYAASSWGRKFWKILSVLKLRMWILLVFFHVKIQKKILGEGFEFHCFRLHFLYVVDWGLLMLAWFYKSHCQRKLGYYSLSTKRWMTEERVSTKSILVSQKTIKKIFSLVKYLFFLSNIKIIYSAWYWPKSLQFGQSAQFGDG